MNALAPASLSDLMQVSEMLAKSSMVPTAYRGKPQDILVCLMWGNEVGLGPVQALNGISVINGKPAMWGDAALALVRGHRDCAGIREWIDGEGDARTAHCEVTRRGQVPEVRTFSVKDAKKAGLWGKQGPWQQYPDRMLQMRARGFAIRDVFPDALRGVITAEEAHDIPVPRLVPNTAQGQAMAQLQPPEEATLPLIGPDAVLYEIGPKGDQPAVTRWMSGARKAIGKMEDRAALLAWRQEMGPLLASISETEPEAVKAVEGAIEARLASFIVQDEPGATEPDDA